MGTQVSRMQFLRGDFKGKEMPLRPPWAIDESLFTEICTNCGECISQCPAHIIKQARANFPVVDFTFGECLFCEECVDVCKPQALLKNTQKSPWSIKASIDKDVCIAHKGVECRSCYDPCESRAIILTSCSYLYALGLYISNCCIALRHCVSLSLEGSSYDIEKVFS